MTETRSEQTVRNLEVVTPNGSGSAPLVPVNDLAIAKQVSSDQRIEEARSLQKVESDVGRKYRGIRGYGRVFQISRVIAMLSLYLYMDQLDLHLAHQNKLKKERSTRAARLTRAAVYGEKLFAVRVWFFQAFLRLLRRFILGSDTNRETN